MKTEADLKHTLRRIEGRGYKAYKDIKDVYDFGEFTLFIDHVQGDPFAAPSRIRAQVSQDIAQFPPDTYSKKDRIVGLCDLLTRMFSQSARHIAKGHRGTGKSGMIEIDTPGQEILERTSVVINRNFVEARCVMGLPASGRRILAREAEAMFFDELPKIVSASLRVQDNGKKRLHKHIEVYEDQCWLRSQLENLGLVAFIANGSLLPRASGVDDRPLSTGRIVTFQSPPSLEMTVELPNHGPVLGMGIPKGVTLIVGGGYHGKSTLLDALVRSVYCHIPGDGRECVVTHSDAVKIRAEDGRRIEGVDISPFIKNLPFGQQTISFSTDDASGSTSQAANIIEALEIEAKVLLMDEDTSATNFMIRDHRMQELVSKEKEPITPFIDKIRLLYREHGVSTVLVMGGSGEYFDVADTVIALEDYVPRDVTSEAKNIAQRYKAERKHEGGTVFGTTTPRIPVAASFDPSRGRKPVKTDAKGLRTLVFGRHTIDLSAVEQIVDRSQTRAIGDALLRASREHMNGRRSLSQIMGLLMDEIETGGLDVLNSKPLGNYALPRRFEVAAAINRLRTLRVENRRTVLN
ncbi:MAG: ABC-ATPase domain-containing protein [Gemmatimonadota bacterium]|nr:MAG: ABC-ATPase domain-containing protein [Gemmatimonadota bacterium]